jgi:hypothetical protein
MAACGKKVTGKWSKKVAMIEPMGATLACQGLPEGAPKGKGTTRTDEGRQENTEDESR